jgi:hypothetical protein
LEKHEARLDADAKRRMHSNPLRTLDSKNPMVQEVVAAALVATAAALKDTKKARAMAEDAGDQLQSLANDSKQKGKALWSLALEVARRAGDIIQEKPKAKAKAKPKATATPKPKAKPRAKPAAAAAKKTPRKPAAKR